MSRALTSLAGLLFIGVLASVTLDGYGYGGHRWASSDVPFFVNPVSRTLSESAVLSALQAAAGHWTAQSGASIRYTYAGRTSGSTLQNNGLSEVFLRNQSNGSYSALTYYWYGPDGKLVDADTVFYEGSYQFFGGSTGCSATGIYLEDVATHEFGHSLGLNHSADSTATMYPTMPSWCTQSWRVLAPDDIAGIRAAYPPTATNPPTPPSALTAVAGTPPSSQVVLAWTDGASNETRFVVQRTSNGTSFAQVAQLGANVKAFTDSGVGAATTYSYRVYASNDAGPSGYSNTATITTGSAAATAVPGAVSGPSPANGATGVRPSAVGWSAATAAQAYDVYFGASPSPPRVSSSQTTTSWATGPLGAGTVYYWRVVAKNTRGATSGPVWSFTTRAKGKG